MAKNEAERRALEADAESASTEELEAAEAILDRDVRYPDIEVRLVGGDGNATSGDYDNVLATAMRWVDVV